MTEIKKLLPILALVAACAGEPPEPATPPAEAVAIWDGGALTLGDVESAFAQVRTPACRRARRGGLDELVPCYRELAEGLALERLVLAEIVDVEAALESLEGYDQLRRHAHVETYLLRVRDEIEIGDAESEARFESDPGRYRRPGAADLANIFRRHDDPARPGDTLAFLRTLKERFEAGETFDALAREYSHSETRSRGGLVGQVTEDRLPERLRRVVFALREGDVSDPVRVRGGAVLLYVQALADPVEPSLADAERRIRREVRAERVENAISARVAGRQPPAGSLVLELDELVEALDTGDPERTVLDVAGDRLRAGGLRRLAGLGTGRAADLEDEDRDRLAERYFREKETRLLALELVDDDDPELHAAAAAHLRQVAVAQLVDERLRGGMEQLIEDDEDRLRSYFEDNRHHYQSFLRFKLRLWSLPFDDNPPGQLRRMEASRERLAAGEIDLAAASDELGGSVDDLGWRQLDALPDGIPRKARTYLLEVGAGGFSVPYQQDNALHLIELVERDDPRPLEYEEAADQVRADYLARFQQELYRRIAEERLDAVGFAFDEAALRRLLTPPGVATFSVLGFDSATGEVGGAVQSRVFSVGNGVLWAEAGVGVVATQAIVDVSYGPQALELLRQGLAPRAIVDKVLKADPDPRPGMWTKEGRQFAVMDAAGRYAAHTGPKASAWAGHRGGEYVTAQGNILAGEAVVDAMVAAFESTEGHLSSRLLAALEAGQKAGGDSRGMQSAAMLIVKQDGGPWLNNDVVLRLQVDDDPEPIRELRRLVEKNL
ncbi:MAG: DUF1028 domain-containing protein, partial [Thermoanaerobaculia bacterium]